MENGEDFVLEYSTNGDVHPRRELLKRTELFG